VQFTLDNGELPRRIAGGHVLVPVWLVCMAWWLYRGPKRIGIADLRVFFACLKEHEGRRAFKIISGKNEFPCRFTIKRLARLTGMPAKRVRESLRRLQAVRLVVWTEAAIGFAPSPDCILVDDLAGFWEMMGKVENNTRRLPIPRRMLNVLAGGARPALVATVLGHLVWCLYIVGRREARRFKIRGRCKTSWIADVFGVALRRVKEARAELVRWRFLEILPSRQRPLNLHGAKVEINPDWKPLDDAPQTAPTPESPAAPPAPPADPGQELAPLPDDSGQELAPPLLDQEPLAGGWKDQEPSAGRPTGVCNHRAGEKSPETTELRAPTMADVRREDLTDTARLLDLHQDATRRGMSTASEAARLRFVAAAERACRVGHKPIRLFVAIVRQRLWYLITEADDKAAMVRLRRYDEAVLNRERGQASKRMSDPGPVDNARRMELLRQIAILRSRTEGS
jgi:hypothetical protein